MKRIIKAYETCSDDLLGHLVGKFPMGIKPRHLQQFTTHKGEKIKVVELITEGTIYLIKFSTQLENAIDNFDRVELDLVEDIEIELGNENDPSKGVSIDEIDDIAEEV